jgi:O-antigen/teichoic acid export membrane protein
LWIGGAISAALSLFAPEILRLLATARYAGASTVVGILAMSYVMIGLTYIAATGPSIAKRTGPTGVAMVSAAVLNVILNVALVPVFGKVGSAVATLLAQSLTPIYLFYRSQQLYHIPYRFRAGVLLVVCTMVIIAAGSRLDIGSLWVALPLKAAILLLYVPLAFGVRLVSPRHVAEMLGRTATPVGGAQA